MRRYKDITVIELFAGVGGFRLGLERASSKYKIIWSNQWEPTTKVQYASGIYIKHWGSKNHSNEDIHKVIDKNFDEIPNHDLLVGGFPCQDYSVAKALGQAKGIKGRKGVLWWSIYEILKRKGPKNRPKYLLLENVNRLLKSPANQRGRDFAVMLASLSKLGYAVEWRIINAADYGMPQKRRRVFILGYKKDTDIYKSIQNSTKKLDSWLLQKSTTTLAFPIEGKLNKSKTFELGNDLIEISRTFSKQNPLNSPFHTAGIMINGKVLTADVTPHFKGRYKTLGDIVKKTKEEDVDKPFFITATEKSKWKNTKGRKSIERKAKNGFKYNYSEGGMVFPDRLDFPSRTIVTGEGGRSPSRFKHVIKTPSGKLRRLIPEELEQLNMFPKNFTKEMDNQEVISDNRRAFLMGNALVVGVVQKFGEALLEQLYTLKEKEKE